jgi:hypothetical protein
MTTLEALLRFWLVLVISAALVVGYTLLVRRLAELLQPMRLEMAELGNRLLKSDLVQEDKNVVKFMVTHAYSPWSEIGFAIVLPFAVVFLIFRRVVGGIQLRAPDSECAKLAHMAMGSMLAASPLAAVFVIAELLTIGFVGFLVEGNVLLVKAIFAALRAEAIAFSSFSHRNATA